VRYLPKLRICREDVMTHCVEGALHSMNTPTGVLPLVSVVVPTRNRPDMLADALASVRAQTFENYEIIVISNGEGANAQATRAVAATCGARYFELGIGNASIARNCGIEHAKGEWVAFLDDDDLWLPRKLEWQLSEAERTGADMIFGDFVEFYPDGREIIRRSCLLDGWSYTKTFNHASWCVQPSTTMVRRHVFAEIGAFDPRLRYDEDLDLWRRISWHHAIHQIAAILVRQRRGHVHLMHPRFERTRYFYNLRYFLKVRRDTPRDLHATLPPAAVVIPMLVGICAPTWLLTFLHWFGPRMRWLEFRRWLGRGLKRLRSSVNTIRDEHI
jgi:glycosyltransferase involved in cell wall biosynthesis